MKHCTQCNFSLQKPVMILKICLYFLLAANIVQWKDNETPKKKKKKKKTKKKKKKKPQQQQQQQQQKNCDQIVLMHNSGWLLQLAKKPK